MNEERRHVGLFLIIAKNHACSTYSPYQQRARQMTEASYCLCMTYNGLSRLQTAIDKINMWILKNINVTSTGALHLLCCAFPVDGKTSFRSALLSFPGGTLNLCVLTFKDTGFSCCCNDFCSLASTCSDSSKELHLLFSSIANGVK